MGMALSCAPQVVLPLLSPPEGLSHPFPAVSDIWEQQVVYPGAAAGFSQAVTHSVIYYCP